MRAEWVSSSVSRGQPMPWTTEVWVLWVILTLPIGLAITAYSPNHKQHPIAAALTAAGLVWLLLTVGMVGYGWSDGVAARVLILDSAVNLVAMAGASLGATALMHLRTRRAGVSQFATENSPPNLR